MKSKKSYAFLAICTTASLFSACGGQNDGSEERLKINKKYVLESWPDSAYIAELDSILQAEPLKANADSERTELTIYSGAIPTISLPGQKKSAKPTNTASQQANAKFAKSEKTAEHFADNFMNALSALQSDPSNSAKYKTVTARAGEDLFALLSRAYGHDATKLPRFYTLSALQSVNPGVKLEHLNGGESVRIPKL
mgnify:FL=1